MRLFIAINFGESIKDKIQDIIQETKKSSVQGKFVNNEHLHLTLEFLGEISPEKVNLIKNVMEQVISKPFEMKLSEIGYFKRQDGNVYWLGIECNELLFKMQDRLHELLIDQGFKLESRAYKPHLTIGRKVKMEDDFKQEKLVDAVNQIKINVDKIDLMKSEHINGRLVHTIIYTKNFKR